MVFDQFFFSFFSLSQAGASFDFCPQDHSGVVIILYYIVFIVFSLMTDFKDSLSVLCYGQDFLYKV